MNTRRKCISDWSSLLVTFSGETHRTNQTTANGYLHEELVPNKTLVLHISLRLVSG
jgi:hypothetical protein